MPAKTATSPSVLTEADRAKAAKLSAAAKKAAATRAANKAAKGVQPSAAPDAAPAGFSLDPQEQPLAFGFPDAATATLFGEPMPAVLHPDDAPARFDGSTLDGSFNIVTGEYTPATPAQQAAYAGGADAVAVVNAPADDVPPGFDAADLSPATVAALAAHAAPVAPVPAPTPKAGRRVLPSCGRSLADVVALIAAHGPVTSAEVKHATGMAQAHTTLVRLSTLGAIVRGADMRWSVKGTPEAALAALPAAKAPKSPRGPSTSKAAAGPVGALVKAQAALEKARLSMTLPGSIDHLNRCLESVADLIARHNAGEQPPAIAVFPPTYTVVTPAVRDFQNALRGEASPAPVKFTAGDAVCVSRGFRADYADLMGDAMTGLVVMKVAGKFATVHPAKGGPASRVNVAHLSHSA